MTARMLRTAPRKYVFVFGSNEGGVHGAGAARTAARDHGAIFGKCYGHYGDSFAIPTKDEYFTTLREELIEAYVKGFLAYAHGKPKVNFMVTTIGTGLAGLMHRQIAPMFNVSLSNLWFDEIWAPWLPKDAKFWGTFES